MTVSSDQRKIIYQGNGTTTQFAVPFYFIKNADIEASVYNGTTTTDLVLGTDYTLSGAGNEAGGALTTVSPVPSGSEIAILRTVAYKQEMDIPENDIFPSQNMERALDRLTMQTQQLAEQVDRSVKVDVFSDVDPAFFGLEIEALYAIKDDMTTDAQNMASITAVKNNATNINTVAGSIANVNAVGANIANVNAVNANKTNINTVAGISSNVTTVAGISSDVTAVKNNAVNITAVAGNATNINAVNANKTNINAVAGNATNINAVNANKTNINAVAGISSNVTTVAGIASDVTAVKNNAANITAVAGNATNINAVKNNATNINAVAGNATNINAVNANKTNIDTVAGNSSNVTTVATNISNVNAVAGDLTNINAVASDLPNIDSASGYATNANVWAEGTDAQVQALGGTHSAKEWANVTSGANKDLSNLTATGNDKFVTKDTAQTITGVKTFANQLVCKNGGTYSTAPATDQYYASFVAYDSTYKKTAEFVSYTRTSGTTRTYMNCYYPNDNTKAAFLALLVDKNGNAATSVTSPTDTTSTSSAQIATTGWVNSVGNNIVHLDGTETITGAKTYTSAVYVVRSGDTALSFKKTNLTNNATSPSSTLAESISFIANDSSYIGSIDFNQTSTGTYSAKLRALRKVSGINVEGALVVGVTNDGSLYSTAPTPSSPTDNSIKIATTAWVDTANKTGNGIGAPNYAAAVDITIDANTTYTATANGWILCRIIQSNTAITIDGVQINQGHLGDNINYGCDVIAPIALGSVLASNTALPSYTVLKFIPCK